MDWNNGILYPKMPALLQDCLDVASFGAEYGIILKDPEAVIIMAKISLRAGVVVLLFYAFPRIKTGLKRLFLIVEIRLLKITTPISEESADNDWNEDRFMRYLHQQRYVEFS